MYLKKYCAENKYSDQRKNVFRHYYGEKKS